MWYLFGNYLYIYVSGCSLAMIFLVYYRNQFSDWRNPLTYELLAFGKLTKLFPPLRHNILGDDSPNLLPNTFIIRCQYSFLDDGCKEHFEIRK